MYLFEDKEKVKISLDCKACLEEIHFEISLEEYQHIENFPLRKENIHGVPAHKLIVYLNKNLDINNFEIEDIVGETEKEAQELTKQVLREINLDGEEIDLYFKCSARDVVSFGELVLLTEGQNEEKTSQMIKKFKEKGLFKEIIGVTPHYTALPPYAALLHQLNQFDEYILNLKRRIPERLTDSFIELEKQTKGIEELKEYSKYMNEVKDTMTSKLHEQKQEFDNTITEIEKIKGINDDIAKLETNTKDIMESQIENVSEQFGEINNNISESMKTQIDALKGQFTHINERISDSIRRQIEDLTSRFENFNKMIKDNLKQQINDFHDQFTMITETITNIMTEQIEELTEKIGKIKAKISRNLSKLELGIVQDTVEEVIETIFNLWLESVRENILNQIEIIQRVSNEGLDKITNSLNKQLVEIKKISNEEIEKTNEGFQAQLKEIDKLSEDEMVKTSISLNRQLKIIQHASNEGIQKIRERFNTELIPKLNKSIETTINNINHITTATANSGDEMKGIFTNISDNFNEVVTNAGEKISSISDNVMVSFKNMKDTFSTEVLETIDKILKQILDRLELSEVTTKEFWEQAKKVSVGTMKDIWFIRSIEGAKATINRELGKAKSKSLVVTPNLTDVNIDAIKSLPKHVNLRIVSNIDDEDEHVLAMMEQLDQMSNVRYKHQELKDIWGINKDYEEVVVCVLSETMHKGERKTEIAGIGSVIPEHIKIFVPIIEDSWLNARKLTKN